MTPLTEPVDVHESIRLSDDTISKVAGVLLAIRVGRQVSHALRQAVFVAQRDGGVVDWASIRLTASAAQVHKVRATEDAGVPGIQIMIHVTVRPRPAA